MDFTLDVAMNAAMWLCVDFAMSSSRMCIDLTCLCWIGFPLQHSLED
jgi:hypothetical protein